MLTAVQNLMTYVPYKLYPVFIRKCPLIALHPVLSDVNLAIPDELCTHLPLIFSISIEASSPLSVIMTLNFPHCCTKTFHHVQAHLNLATVSAIYMTVNK
jgi:hypothetical protein